MPHHHALKLVSAAAAAMLLLTGCDSASSINSPPARDSGGVDSLPAEPVFDDCGDGLPPDEACFARTRAPESQEVAMARAIADRQIARRPPESLRWDWGEAVMLLGVYQLARITGEERYLDYPRAWLDHHIESGYTIRTSDTCAPAALAALMYSETGDERYSAVVDDAFYYLNEESLRTPEGGLNHLGIMDIFGVSLWVDSLFMFGNVMHTWAEITGDPAPLDDFVEQYEIFAEALQTPSGFFMHATESEFFPQDDNVYWGRGNGWVVAAAYDHLRIRHIRGEEPPPRLRASLELLVSAAINTQDLESGLWWTVLNRPGESYLETSTAALFAFGLARGFRYGLLGDEVLPVIRRAVVGLRERIEYEDEGHARVTGISDPTNVGDFEYYRSVHQNDCRTYGVGAVLLALTEVSGLPLSD